MDQLTKAAWLIPLFPFASFLLLTALGRSYRLAGVLIGSIGSLASLVMSLLVFIERLGPNAVDYSGDSYKWIGLGEYTLKIGFEITNLNALMLVIVTVVSFLVNVYSAGYMKKDERITVFYGYVALFTFAMLGLVLSDNMLVFYMFWELVGVCSFLLVGFWYAKPAARAAAKKAFIVTRIGDAGLLLGIIVLFWYMPGHALDFSSIHNVFTEGQSGTITMTITTSIALLLFMGVIGKSGQFPLHVWLPDAMEGPTPISALIHAATMVAAGVFLLARTFDIFEASASAMHTVAYFGGFTAIFAATVALAQNDIKRILAYSTISQLGYMVMAMGLGSMTGGVFHLFTHAFFKALLFLAAGSVIHAVHTQNIHEMGGLGSKMRITAWTFAIGALSLSGIPPFSGFWSKDAILASALDENPFLFAVGLAAAFCTALYMSRLFFIVFMGKSRLQQPAEVKESSKVMTIPLLVLAVISVGAGFIETPWNGWLGSWLTDGAEEVHASGAAIVASIAVGVLGIYVGWLMYGKGSIERGAAAAKMPWLVNLLERQYYVNEFYNAVIVNSVRALGKGLNAFDEYVIGGAVRLVGFTAGAGGRVLTRLNNGQTQTYGLTAIIGLIVIIAAIVGRRFW
ncbi:NADH-quinone oxidoreductase subunit L [Paenibacillus sp. JDR-2]|uniref:NADH-quinone oxidoreductase subunit L n=1 Tax=Paenibacillus sp. (strain JDR-2) TaxID=324057 RepID=UPI0001667C9C|nr:NADH-quinone oxidoreductase subunit L [Paenibacillus sp. JDR-2]ACT04411.1 proton-translocating NADH-quinone oxidoreductase, chain L [Paenibacillus sp. JDR-2]